MKKINTVLLVIDIQNDFCTEGSIYNKNGYPVIQNQKIAKKIKKAVENLREKGVGVYYLISDYSNYYIQGKKCNFCLEGTTGAKSFLNKDQADRIIIKKTHDGFWKTKLDYFLKLDNIKNILVAGISTSVCVDTTARSGVIRGYKVTILEDCVASKNKQMHECSLKNFKDNFGFVKKISNFLEEKN